MPNIHHPDVMRSILAGIVDTGDVIGPAGPGQTILAVTVDNWLIDELAALGSDVADRSRRTPYDPPGTAPGGPGALRPDEAALPIRGSQ